MSKNKKILNDEAMKFLHKQTFVIVSTIDKSGSPHSSCKGIVKITSAGSIYLLDLYKKVTFSNLKRNSHIAVTAVDEHRFSGYCLKGRARIVRKEKLSPQIIKAWEKRLTQRITKRVLKNMAGVKGRKPHTEILLPDPEYMIVMQPKQVVDLTPHHLKQTEE